MGSRLLSGEVEMAQAVHQRHMVRPAGFARTATRPDRWIGPDGTDVQDDGTLARLRALAIPPAWTHVWVSPDPEQAVQATGVDSRGRTQYRYSAAAREFAANEKFEHVVTFAAALPELRGLVAGDIARAEPRGATRPRPERSLAAIVRLLDRGLFRVGNERYARDNHTYGLTTLRRDQLVIKGDAATFAFVGKEHKPHRITVADPAVAAVLRALARQDRDAEDVLFAYGRAPAWHHLDSAAVNAYLHAHTAAPATAKVFRTWGATVAAAAVSAGAAVSGEAARKRRTDLRAFAAAADLLGDTIAVTRASYVHPRALDAGADAGVRAALNRAAGRAGTEDVRGLFSDEELQVAILRALAEG
jgi:DNA topoisomerase-1